MGLSSDRGITMLYARKCSLIVIVATRPAVVSAREADMDERSGAHELPGRAW